MSPYHPSPPAVDTVAGQLPGFVEHFLARVAAASDSGATEAASAAPAVHLADRAARSSPLVPPAAGTIVSCHFTYKGLGYPLGVLHRYASYSVALDGGMARWTTPGEAGSHLALLPQHPVYALLAGVLLPLSLGARLVVVRRFDPRGVYDLLVQHRTRFACLVPLLFRALAARPRPRGELHSHLQLLSGGSYLTPELTASVAGAIGIEPLQGYGLSETLPATVNYPGR